MSNFDQSTHHQNWIFTPESIEAKRAESYEKSKELLEQTFNKNISTKRIEKFYSNVIDRLKENEMFPYNPSPKHLGKTFTPLRREEEDELRYFFELSLYNICKKMADDQTKSEKKRNVQYQRSSIFYVSMMYFKRFFLTRSILNYNIFGMIGACILLACKVEETPISVDELKSFIADYMQNHTFSAIYSCLYSQTFFDMIEEDGNLSAYSHSIMGRSHYSKTTKNEDTRSDILSIEKTPDINDFETDNVRIDDLQEVIVHNEILLLEGIHYNLSVYTPYSVIQYLLEELRNYNEDHAISFNEITMTKIVNECNHIIRTLLYTDVPLLYSPSDIALYAFFNSITESEQSIFYNLVIPKEHQDSIQSRLDQIHQLFNKQTQLESQYNISINHIDLQQLLILYLFECNLQAYQDVDQIEAKLTSSTSEKRYNENQSMTSKKVRHSQ